MRSLLSQKLTRTDISELESLARCSSSATVRELLREIARTDISELESLARCSSSATVRELLREIARTARDGEDIVAAKPSNAR